MAYVYVRKNTAIIVDDADKELMFSATRRWKYASGRAHSNKWTNLTYALLPNGKRKVVRLGRFLAGFPEGKRVHYVGRNRKDMRRKNLRVGGQRMDLDLPEGLMEAVLEDLKIPVAKPAEKPLETPNLQQVILPGGARHFVPDPNSKLGPIIQYKIWLKRTGNIPRGSTHA